MELSQVQPDTKIRHDREYRTRDRKRSAQAKQRTITRKRQRALKQGRGR